MLSMRHHTQSGSGKQISLAFNPMAITDSKSVLYMAYGKLELSRHLSFEQVMSIRVIAIGVRNMADAITRREGGGIEHEQSTPRRNINCCAS